MRLTALESASRPLAWLPHEGHEATLEGGEPHHSTSQEAHLKATQYKDFARRFPRLMNHLPTYSLAWWLMPMTSFGVSTLLSFQRSLHDFNGLRVLGLIVYFVGLAQFIFVLVMQTARFIAYPGQFRHALSISEEAMFGSAFFISCYGILSGGADFAEPAPGTRLSYMFLALFWIYLAVALVGSLFAYLLIFDGGHLQGRNMTPAWLLPILPVVLTGVLASSVIKSVYDAQRYALLIAGTFTSGLGFLMSLSFFAIYILRLFSAGLPDPNMRPGMMIAVGPPAYAPYAWLQLVQAIPTDYGYFQSRPGAATALEVVTLFGSIAAIGIAVFFMLIAVVSVARGGRKTTFHLTWYGLIFPNVGLLECIGSIGLLLPSPGMIWVVSVGTVLLVGLWLFVLAFHVRWVLLYNAPSNRSA